MKPTEILNWRKISIALSGNPEGVRSTYSGKKYQQEVDELVNFAEDWLKRNSKSRVGWAKRKQNGRTWRR